MSYSTCGFTFCQRKSLKFEIFKVRTWSTMIKLKTWSIFNPRKETKGKNEVHVIDGVTAESHMSVTSWRGEKSILLRRGEAANRIPWTPWYTGRDVQKNIWSLWKNMETLQQWKETNILCCVWRLLVDSQVDFFFTKSLSSSDGPIHDLHSEPANVNWCLTGV